MKKNIWIINHYACDTFFDKGGRHYYFAKYLKQLGYNPTVFCGNSVHGEEKTYFENLSRKRIIKTEPDIGVRYVFIEARPCIGNGKERILNMIDFYKNVKYVMNDLYQKGERPDIIYASSVHPLTLVAGIKMAAKFGIKCICEVRDLWPESIVEYSARLTKKNPIIKALYAGEKWIYKKADALIFTMKGGADYIEEKKWDKEIPREKIFHINNGVDLEQFDNNVSNNTFLDADFSSEAFKVVYTGSMGQANSIGTIVEAAKLLKNEPVLFLLWGKGPEKEKIERIIRENNLQNVRLKGFVNKQKVPSILAQADLNIFALEKSPLFRFGLSLNKSFEYAASGKPTLVIGEAKYDVIEEFRCGKETGSWRPQAVADAIIGYMKMPKSEYEELCGNARNAAKAYDFKNLTKQLADIIEAL
ncbi:MAG: glycosyltransferase family 4 protein [Clostridia bacterium]|nr:glycosyltransferase family 4 protein [Clostridia bacterium]